ncbi:MULTISPECIES: hypothetical protein [Citrobacter]|uniref:hypothetical protein n=1 Tax=Citrobacter TaxID=544 RepID=UPI00027288C0|nr:MULTISPECIES: hypothetical protein [Citrobacter]NTX82618.1 nucleotidyltransferase [Citrobacter youngae]EJF20609.1 hypothetical protein WYG_4489 [Citrobacter sp. A1]EKT9310775.1 nucleotidyltransferase [Citrobacter freundii]EKU32120.1 hypothetical protein B397_4645 [Citrobacter sp. L17]EKX9621798.1 nucleotidyltransferase [Citrobacter freundii]
MSYQVSTAFNSFMNNFVNLDANDTREGRKSRDWLVDEQLLKFPGQDETFPLLSNAPKMWFGSFSRRTKIRELDDIDMMIIMHAQGSTYYDYGSTVNLSPGQNSRFLNYLDDSGQWINSRKVVNKFVSSLKEVPQYSKADSKRQGEAATLKLLTRSWNFDIVPAFITSPEADGTTFYLIPDGAGHWKKTDPRIDKDRTTRLNQKHDGNVLNAIRLVKYWKRKRGVPTIGSYLLETILLNRYEHLIQGGMSEWVDNEFPQALRALASAILGPVYDQKDFQGDINNLSSDDRWKVWEKATTDASLAEQALAVEFSDPVESGKLWQRVLGSDFPADAS